MAGSNGRRIESYQKFMEGSPLEDCLEDDPGRSSAEQSLGSLVTELCVGDVFSQEVNGTYYTLRVVSIDSADQT